MRLFFEAWQHVFPDSANHQTVSDEILIRQISSDELNTVYIQGIDNNSANYQVNTDYKNLIFTLFKQQNNLSSIGIIKVHRKPYYLIFIKKINKVIRFRQ